MILVAKGRVFTSTRGTCAEASTTTRTGRCRHQLPTPTMCDARGDVSHVEARTSARHLVVSFRWLNTRKKQEGRERDDSTCDCVFSRPPQERRSRNQLSGGILEPLWTKRRLLSSAWTVAEKVPNTHRKYRHQSRQIKSEGCKAEGCIEDLEGSGYIRGTFTRNHGTARID